MSTSGNRASRRGLAGCDVSWPSERMSEQHCVCRLVLYRGDRTGRSECEEHCCPARRIYVRDFEDPRQRAVARKLRFKV